MAKNNSFVDFLVKDQLAPLKIEARKMFGGFGLYHSGKFFGLISSDDCLYLKTDEKSRAKFVAAGMQVFTPNPRQTLKSYYQVPIDVLEDDQQLQRWVLEAVEVK